MPSGWTSPSRVRAGAASAIVVRNGPRKTVMTVVGKAEIAQS